MQSQPLPLLYLVCPNFDVVVDVVVENKFRLMKIKKKNDYLNRNQLNQLIDVTEEFVSSNKYIYMKITN